MYFLTNFSIHLESYQALDPLNSIENKTQIEKKINSASKQIFLKLGKAIIN